MKLCITGASSGIGKAMTKYFVNKGHMVFGVSRQKEILKELKEELGDNFYYAKCNVKNLKEIQILKKKMDELKFYPDIIICGAGIFKEDIGSNFNINQYKEVFDVNLFGNMNFIEVFLTDFLNKKKGHFITLSSISAFRPNLQSISYPASKAALSLTFRGLDLIYRKKGIYFSNIYLGPVDTPMLGGKQSFLIANPKNIAKKINNVIKSKRKIYFIPFLSTFLFRISRLIPDRLYSYLSKNIIKK